MKITVFAGSESGLTTKTGWSGDALLSFALLLLQEQPDAMQVGRQHRQSNRTRETVRTMAADAVESPMLQPIDGRPDRRMRTPCGHKRLRVFSATQPACTVPVHLSLGTRAPLRVRARHLLGTHLQDGFDRRTAHGVDHLVDGSLALLQQLDEWGPAVARPSPARPPAPGCWPWTPGARSCTASSSRWLLLSLDHPTYNTVGQGVATDLLRRLRHACPGGDGLWLPGDCVKRVSSPAGIGFHRSRVARAVLIGSSAVPPRARHSSLCPVAVRLTRTPRYRASRVWGEIRRGTMPERALTDSR